MPAYRLASVPILRRPGIPWLPVQNRRISSRQRSIRLRKNQRDRTLHSTVGTYTRYGDVAALASLQPTTNLPSSVLATKSGSTSILQLPGLPTAGCATTSSQPMGTKKTWTSTPRREILSLLCRSLAWENIRTRQRTFPLDDAHLNYLLEYNTRHMSGNEQRGYWFDYGETP